MATYSPNTGATLEHKLMVMKEMQIIINELMTRMVNHDFSKLSEEEAPYFEQTLPRLAKSTYGTPGYGALLDELKPALNNHYKENHHHPEHHENGINDMNLIDLIEMLCDWKAATKRHNDGDITRSLEINSKRFDIPEAIVNAIKNTNTWMSKREEPGRLKEQFVTFINVDNGEEIKININTDAPSVESMILTELINRGVWLTQYIAKEKYLRRAARENNRYSVSFKSGISNTPENDLALVTLILEVEKNRK